jgi:hypothetical protein
MPIVDTRQPNTFTSCYPEDTFLWVELELGFTHIGESFHEVGYVRGILLACYYDVIHIREYIPAGPLVLPSSFCKMWDLHCVAPPTFSCSSTCQMVL